LTNYIILKIAQRCNLNCGYCYVYNQGDDSWKFRDKFISIGIIKKIANKVSSHIKKNQLKEFSIELHGGEPLLIGKNRFFEIVSILRERVEVKKLNIFLQSNGILLDYEWLKIFNSLDVTFSLSIDGPSTINDKYRKAHNSQPYSKNLFENLRKLSKEKLFHSTCTGFLCVIHPYDWTGKEAIQWFLQNNINNFDFLLPDGTYENLPSGISDLKTLDFLKNGFDYWWSLEGRAPKIRIYETIVKAIFGMQLNLDSFGGDISSMCVIETNGAIGVHDVLRITSKRYRTDLINIKDKTFEDFEKKFNVNALQKKCAKCLKCEYLNICGSGYLPHRYSEVNQFDNPTIYCRTMFELISHVIRTLSVDQEVKKYMIRNTVPTFDA